MGVEKAEGRHLGGGPPAVPGVPVASVFSPPARSYPPDGFGVLEGFVDSPQVGAQWPRMMLDVPDVVEMQFTA